MAEVDSRLAVNGDGDRVDVLASPCLCPVWNSKQALRVAEEDGRRHRQREHQHQQREGRHQPHSPRFARRACASAGWTRTAQTAQMEARTRPNGSIGSLRRRGVNETSRLHRNVSFSLLALSLGLSFYAASRPLTAIKRVFLTRPSPPLQCAPLIDPQLGNALQLSRFSP